VFNLHSMKVNTENDNNFGYEKIMILVDNMPLMCFFLLILITYTHTHVFSFKVSFTISVM